MKENKEKYKFYVEGMHCSSCVVLTEQELLALPAVSGAKADLGECCVEVAGEFSGKTPEEVAALLSPALESHGYKILTEKPAKKIKWSEFKIAVPITLFFVLLYIFLQKIGLVNLVTTDKVSYGTAFVLGVIASLSTCMAVVGGLVLSVSANFAKEGDKTRPQILFHLGRFVAFFGLGGAIGSVGSAFQAGPTGVFVMSLLVGAVMLLLGINLLDVFPATRKLQLRFPKIFSAAAHNPKNLKHTLGPALLGVVTFFLPCGFTQAMQVYALSTGSFWSGALLLSIFALGTFPVLALLSFWQVGIKKIANLGIFYKTAGLIVILFALFNIVNSLVIIGVIPPVFNF